MYLIAGITGHVGGAAASRLLAEGQSVRALVRDLDKAACWADRGVDLRQGDFADPLALTHALDGVAGAFLMLPPFFTPGADFAEAGRMVASFSHALRAAPPPKLVALSSVGSEQSSGLGMITSTHLLEEGLRDIGFPITFIRPGSFLENYVGALATAKADGVFETYLAPTDRDVPMAASVDIGNEVARRLLGEWRGEIVVELGSRISPDALAQAMEVVLQRPVCARAIPREQWTAHLEGQGMPPGFIGPFSEMEDGFNSGWIDFGRPGAETVKGATPPEAVFAHALKSGT